jgi:hypothetical protein
MAMMTGHQHVFSEQLVTHFDEFPSRYWTGRKRLRLISKTYSPTKHFEEARRLFADLSDEQIFRFILNTCHDVTFNFLVDHYEHS